MAIGQEIGFFYTPPGARVPTPELDCILDNYRGCVPHGACLQQDLREFKGCRFCICRSPREHRIGPCQKPRVLQEKMISDLRRRRVRATR